MKEEAQPLPQSPWRTRVEAAAFLRCSTKTVDRCRVFWTDNPPTPGKFRYVMARIGTEKLPRIWVEDLERAVKP